MIEIIPAILTDKKKELVSLFKKVDGEAPRVQVDIIDGYFADSKTVDPSIISSLKPPFLIDFHLMVNNPIEWISKCRGVGGRIIGHVEKMENQSEFVKKVKGTGIGAGLALDLETPVSKIDEDVLRKLDVVLVMSVKAGRGGQEFNNEVLAKIHELNDLRVSKRFTYRICVDGGINHSNIKEVVKHGADEVAVGRRLFDGDLKENIDHFKEAGLESEHVSVVNPRPAIKNIAFFGDSQTKEDDPTYKDAFEIAKHLAEEGFTIVNGGGPGIMNASTQGAEEGGGETISVTFSPTDAPGFEGRYVGNATDREIKTTNYIERMFKLMEHADMYIMFKGGSGTISEFGTAWVLAKLYYGHHKPFILYGDFWVEIIDVLKKNMNLDKEEMSVFEIVDRKEDILPTARRFERRIAACDHTTDCKVCLDKAFMT